MANKAAWLFLFALFSVSSYAQIELGTPDRGDIEYPDDEEHSSEEVELGKILFFDPRLSVNNKQSCASCHNPDLGFGDGLAKSIGTTGTVLDRNTPHLYNLAWNVIFFWDGRARTLEEQALGPIQSKAEMGMDLETLVRRLNKVPEYKKRFKAIYGTSSISAELVGRAIAAFERSIISDNSPFDRYLAGEKSAMSEEAIRGLALFEGKAQCNKCHDGQNFTDNSFHNIGTPTTDVGRFSETQDKTLVGAMKTPGLRNALLTAPYMHDGSLGTLEDVVRFYNKGGTPVKNLSNLIKPLNLSESEIMDLVAFLGALTDPVQVTRPKIPK